jgi:hypothetical protein
MAKIITPDNKVHKIKQTPADITNPGNLIKIPVPEPQDLPDWFLFEGWMRAINQYNFENEEFPNKGALGWFAYIHYQNPSMPPMARQIMVTFWELENLSEKQRIRLVKEKIMSAVKEIQISISALGWDKGVGPDLERVKKGLG